MPTKKKAKRTRLGLELEGAFKEMAAHLRGEIQLPSYEVYHDLFTPKRIKMIRRKVATSTKEFERLPARWNPTSNGGHPVRKPKPRVGKFLSKLICSNYSIV